MKFRTFLFLTLPIAALIGVLAIYLGFGSRSVADPESTTTLTVESAPPVVAATAAEPEPTPKPEKIVFRGRLSPDEAPPEAFSSNPPRDAEETRIIQVARSDNPDPAKVERLLTMIPTLSPYAKQLAMEHATALIPDADYLRYRTRLYHLATDDDLRQTVFLDVLTRGEDLRLPTLVDMLRQPPHKGQDDAREVLVAYLEKDYGADAAAWEALLRLWMAQNIEPTVE